MKTLIITEKPSVAADFAKALKAGGKRNGYIETDKYLITWAVGHLVTLFEPEDYDAKWKKWNMNTLPVTPDKFRYKPIPDTQKQLTVIKTLLDRNPEKIVIATDAGREGEVIARTILEYTGFNYPDRMYRFWTSQALTPQVVLEGLNELKPASEYDRLWRAGRSRQIADWLIGMNCSRAATIKLKDLFSVGRVQTAVLALLVDRRRERENFKPEPYWILRAVFINDSGTWTGTWFHGGDIRFKTEQETRTVRDRVDGKTGSVLSVKNQKKNQPPPFLYSLTDLQRDANIRFGFSARLTLDIAQALYEKHKCLSYPRTDSKVLGTKNVDPVKSIIGKLSAVYPDYFANVQPKLISVSNKRVFNDAGLTDHHAIIPLRPPPGKISRNEHNIYTLVLKRFAAAFHPDCRFEQTEIITEVEQEKFRTKGKRILKPGWRAVYDDPEPSKEGGDEAEPENLPRLAGGDPAETQETRIEQKKTTPPPAYTEALLLKDMTNPGKYVAGNELKTIYRGETGLGTQATRSQIIETLLSRQYAERIKKILKATDKGRLLIDTLRRFNVTGNLTSPEETARWEMELNRIAQGQGSGDNFLRNIESFVEQSVKEFAGMKNMVPRNDRLGSCPVCGGEVIRGKRDYGCSNWKTENGGCRFVMRREISGKILSPHMISTLLQKREAGPLPGFKDSEGRNYTGILKLVEQDGGWTVQVEKSNKNPAENSLGLCPACGGDIIETPKAYGCANWREENGGCKFAVWKTIAKKKISKKIAKQLLTHGISDKIDGFVSKKKTNFSARLKLQPDESGIPETVFEFDNSSRRG